jgi:hypothetical protein
MQYILFFRWNNPIFLHVDYVRSFDHWWLFHHHLKEWTLLQWNPYYLLGQPAVLWYQLPISIFTPILLFIDEFTPEVFRLFHVYGFLMASISIYLIGRILDYDRFISLLPLSLIVVISGFVGYTSWTAYINYAIFYPIAVAFLIKILNNEYKFSNKRRRSNWFLLILFLSLSFLGIKLELMVHCIAFILIIFISFSIYKLKKYQQALSWLLYGVILISIVLFLNSWQLLFFKEVMADSSRVSMPFSFIKLFDSIFWHYILSSIKDQPMLILAAFNLILYFVTRKIHRLNNSTMPFAIGFGVLLLIVLLTNFYILNQLNTNYKNYFTLLNIACIVLSGGYYFFTKKYITIKHILLFIITIYSSLYIMKHITLIGYGVESIFILGCVNLLKKRKTWAILAIILYLFLGETGRFVLYEIFGIIWLVSRDFQVIVPIVVLFILEAALFIIACTSSMVFFLTKKWNYPSIYGRVNKLGGIMSIMLVFPLFSILAPLPLSQLPLDVNKYPLDIKYPQGVNYHQLLQKNYEYTKNLKENFKENDIAWQRIAIYERNKIIPMFLQKPNSEPVYSTEIPKTEFNVFYPNRKHELFKVWHPEMSPIFINYLNDMKYEFTADYGQHVILSPDIGNVLHKELMALEGSNTKRAFLTKNIIKFSSHQEEYKFLENAMSKGYLLSDQITTSDPNFYAPIEMLSEARLKKNDLVNNIDFKLDLPEHIIFEVTTNEKSYLALMDLWSNGWEATVDGITTKIYKGYIGTRFIIVPKGKHIIEFKYDIINIYSVFTISVLILGIIIFLIIINILLTIPVKQYLRRYRNLLF